MVCFQLLALRNHRSWLLLGLEKKSPYKCCATHLSIKAFVEPSHLPMGIRCLFWKQKINRLWFFIVVVAVGLIYFACDHYYVTVSESTYLCTSWVQNLALSLLNFIQLATNQPCHCPGLCAGCLSFQESQQLFPV